MDEIRRLLTEDQAHVGFDTVVAGVDMATINEVRGHSLWQLLEHIRIAQRDLLEYMTDADYVETREFPGDYWPSQPGDLAALGAAVSRGPRSHRRAGRR